MKPPNNAKAARPGAALDPNTHEGINDTHTVPRQRGPRHVPGRNGKVA